MSWFIDKIKTRARKNPKKIVFTETDDVRILKAVRQILKERLAVPVLVGEEKNILRSARKLKINPKKIEIIEPRKSKELGDYASTLYELRKEKGLSLEEANKLVRKPIYFGMMMLKIGKVDGLIAGATTPTSDTLKPAFQIIKTREQFHKVSGAFFMVKGKKVFIFADSAVNILPNEDELAMIAIDSAQTALNFGLKPKIAMLSFSTKGSAKHPLADKVINATNIIKKLRPDLIVDGEMQVDAAINKGVCKLKCPGCKLKGNANILIFPDLQSANIAYKLVERLGNAKAIGPILQGLVKPVNDLSRGCDVEDIVNLTAITVIQAQGGL